MLLSVVIMCAIIVRMSLFITLTSGVCLNCDRSEMLRIPAGRLRQSLIAMDQGFSMKIKSHIVERLFTSGVNLVNKSANTQIINIQVGRKDPDIVTQFSPILSDDVRDRRDISNRTKICKKYYSFHQIVNNNGRVVSSQLELPIQLLAKMKSIDLLHHGHGKRHSHRLPISSRTDLSESKSIIVPLPRRLRSAAMVTIRVKWHPLECQSKSTSDERFRRQTRLIVGIDEENNISQSSRKGRSLQQNGRKLISDCEELWDRAFLESDDSEFVMTMTKDSCCRRRLQVDLSDTVLGGWIDTPKSFQAHYCIGRCSEFGSFSGDFNVDTDGVRYYASLLNERKDSLEVRPCCAPIAFRPLIINIMKGDGQTITQTISNFVVDKCGCV